MNEKIFLFEYACSGALESPESSITIEGLAMFMTLKNDFEKALYPVNCFVSPKITDFPEIPVADFWSEQFDEHLSSSDHAMIIAPESWGILWELIKKVEKNSCGNLGSDSKAVYITSDKYLTYKKLNGINTPKTMAYDRKKDIPMNFPFITKPRDGVSGEGVFIVNSREEMEQIPSDYIIQEYVPGKSGSASCLVGDETRIISFNTQEQENFTYQGARIPFRGVDPEPFYKTVDKIPGLFGYVGIDFVQDEDEEIHIIEINPRPTTPILGFEKAYGINLGQLIMDNYYGRNIPEIKIRNNVIIKKSPRKENNSIYNLGNYSLSLEVQNENTHL